MTLQRTNRGQYLSRLLLGFVLVGCVAEPISITAVDAEVPEEGELANDSFLDNQDRGTSAADMRTMDQIRNDANSPIGSEDAEVVAADGEVVGDDAFEDDTGADVAVVMDDAAVSGDGTTDPPEPSACRVPAPAVENFCTGASLAEYHCESYAGPSLNDATQIGSPTPTYIVQDLQPQSCSFEQYHGLEAFRGTPTMVVLLWAGCGFCQKQTEKLQQMHYELMGQGVTVNFVIINKQAEDPLVQMLADRCNFPILQDEASVNAWGLHSGGKDDFYFYDSLGVLKHFIPSFGDIVLSSSEDPPVEPTSGYSNIKNTVLELVEHDGEPPVITAEEAPSNDE